MPSERLTDFDCRNPLAIAEHKAMERGTWIEANHRSLLCEAGNAPAGGDVFQGNDCRARRVCGANAKVSNLRRAASAPAVNLAVDDQRAADTRADIHVENRRYS